MEPHTQEQSPSPSESEEMESDGDSEQEDDNDNQSRDGDTEKQEESDKESSSSSDDEDNEDNDNEEEEDEDDDDDEEEEEESEAEEGSSDNKEASSPNGTPNGDKNGGNETSSKQRKSSNSSYEEGSPKSKAVKTRSLNPSNMDCIPLDDLPLEVITTVEPTNYSYPVLKNMSNGVLTHRNIFTEHERAVLREIINKYRNIVDTRSRTREIYLEKQSVWQQIVEEYNSTENIMVRTEKELRKCWDNMKYRAKQAEKEVGKMEKFDGGIEGMDLHTLAQQAFEEAVRIQQGEPAKMEQGDRTYPNVKMEPQENHDAGDDEGDSNPEGLEGDNGTVTEEDREPALKRARRESPKLSSLLLAAPRKRTSPSSKKSARTNYKKNNSNTFSYNLPDCTKVMPVKKGNRQVSVNSSTTTGINPVTDLPVSILPKGLGACLSITNIPNPVSAANHVQNNPSHQLKDSRSSLTSPVKPMPSLKKMVPRKHQTNGNCKNYLSNSSKKSPSHRLNDKSHSLTNSIGFSMEQNLNTMNSLAGIHGVNSMLSGGLYGDEDKSLSPEKLLSMKLTTQRLELERREHEIRMKLLEKELQSQTYQSQYWALKLKLLRSGRDINAFNMAGATNGDID